MNMFARFDENPAMTLRTDGHLDGRKHARTDKVKTVYPPQTKFAGGIKISVWKLNFLGLSKIYMGLKFC